MRTKKRWKTGLKAACLLLTGMLSLGREENTLTTHAAPSIDYNACLSVDGVYFFDDGVIYCNSVTDGKGGTAVYDFAKNTLTLTNYTFDNPNGEVFGNGFISANHMPENFRIILKGVNRVEKSEATRIIDTVEYPAFQFLTDATIEGEGKLISNLFIGGGHIIRLKSRTVTWKSTVWNPGLL